MNYTISQTAQKFHLGTPTLRYYEKEGILFPKKTEKGIRVYTDTDFEQLEMVCCLKATGMPLKDIRRYFELCAQGDCTIEQRLQIFTSQREHILEEIVSLQKNLEKINGKIKWYKQKHGVKD